MPDRPLRKTPLQQKAHLLGPAGGIQGHFAELAAPDFDCPGRFGVGQPAFEFLQGFSADTVLLQLGDDAAVAVARPAPVDQRLGKTLRRQPVVFLKEVEQRLKVVALFRISGQLAPQLDPAVSMMSCVVAPQCT